MSSETVEISKPVMLLLLKDRNMMNQISSVQWHGGEHGGSDRCRTGNQTVHVFSVQEGVIKWATTWYIKEAIKPMAAAWLQRATFLNFQTIYRINY